MEIKAEHVIGLVETVREGLGAGSAEGIPGQSPCIQNVVSSVMGLGFGDQPRNCVIEPALSFGIRANDTGGWRNERERGEAMMRFGVAEVGSAGVVDPDEWSRRFCEIFIKEVLPDTLRLISDPECAATAATAARRKVWRQCLEIGVRVFEEMDSPGARLLWLTKPGAIEEYQETGMSPEGFTL